MSQLSAQERSNKRLALSIFAVACLMLGMAFAAVPLYRMFCQVTGFAGTPVVAKTASATQGKRIMNVRFDANVSPELDWSFRPDVNSIDIRTGKTVTIFYKVTNNSSERQTAMATFNVSPDQAGGYFNKISCFCFTDQTLDPGQTVDMPVVFYLDPELEKDETMRNIAGVTLSYTFIAKKQTKQKSAAAPAKPSGKTKL
ncbi:MAG: cytochrome c oxidase assembly protein [Hyphomicrobiales bacterium]|nr:cytochrome c oxidase assembly protein [Hyphomicrobiales bacterium]